MKVLSKTEISVSFLRIASVPKVFLLKGDVFAIDTHSISYSLSTPFFPRR